MLTRSQTRTTPLASAVTSTPLSAAPVAAATSSPLTTSLPAPTLQSASATPSTGVLGSQPQQSDILLQTADGRRVPLRAFVQSVVAENSSTRAGRQGSVKQLRRRCRTHYVLGSQMGALALGKGKPAVGAQSSHLGGNDFARGGWARGGAKLAYFPQVAWEGAG